MILPAEDHWRLKIDELLQKLRNTDPEETRPAVLTGWVFVAEWVDETGESWLSKGHSMSTKSWQAKGMHHEALFGEWPDEDAFDKGDG